MMSVNILLEATGQGETPDPGEKWDQDPYIQHRKLNSWR